VEAERIVSGETFHAGSAYLVFVALDDEGRPRPVPPVVAETPLQQRRQREATIRRQTRLEHRKAIEQHRQVVATERADRPDEPEDDGGSRPHLRI